MTEEEAQIAKLIEFTNSILSNQYYLDGKIPKRGVTIEIYKDYEEHPEKKRIARTQIGDVVVSTVFLMIDHGFLDETPILFETMIFGGEYNDFQERYETWEEAEEGHALAVKLVKEAINEDFK
jgi:hypothetical protein